MKTNTTTAALLPLLLTATARAQWAQVSPIVEPGARGEVAMCAFPPTGGVLMFGGNTYAFPNPMSSETWGYDGLLWTNLAPATTPPGAGGAGMVFDMFRGVAVMFGGRGNSFPGTVTYNATWEFDGIDWANVTPAAPGISPSARAHHGMAFDIARNVTVVYAGEAATAGPPGIADTWEFDGTTGTWTQVTATSAPGRRTKMAMCYALTAAGSVMFGGFDPLVPGLSANDTWIYDGASWTVANVIGQRPAPRWGAGMVYDDLRGVCVMAGGVGANAVPLDETWEYDPVAKTWTEILSSIGGARRSVGLAYDPARGKTILSGGVTVPVTAGVPGTWEFDTASLAFGRGCAGSNGVPTLDATAAPTLGQLYTLEMTNLPTNIAPATGIGLLAFSNAKLALPLDLGAVLGMTGCVAYLPADTLETVVGTNGDASWSIPVPNNPALLGGTLLSQLYTYDPGVNAFGFVNSNAHIGTLGN